MKPAKQTPCSCGSGKPYAQCCGQAAPPSDEINALIALYNTRRYAELESRARKLSERYPDFGFGWQLLGGALQMQGKDALHAFRKTAQLLPDDAVAHYNLGVAQKSVGRLDEAVVSYRRAISLKPDYVEAHYNLGNALKQLGQLEGAAQSYRRAVQLKPDHADAYNNLGAVLKDLGQYRDALDNYRRVLEIKPNSAESYNNMGIALRDLDQLDSAVDCYRQAVKISPEYAEAHYNLGNVLKDLGQLEAAVASYHRALEIKPDLADAYSNLGGVLTEMGQYEAALESYRRALEIKPGTADAHFDLGNALKYLGRVDDAMASYRKALEITPDYVEVQSNIQFTLNFSAQHSPAYCLAEAREYGRMAARKATARFTAWQCAAHPERLRVGLLSGDLHSHPVGFFLEGLLAHLDPSRIELIAYPTHHKQDELTTRIRRYFPEWKPLFGLNDAAAARLIHADGVHVLIDLSGHTAHNRLPVFAWKPAPVQATWLGYFATTGVAEIDYLLADQVGVPEAQQAQFTESLWYLPDTRLCFTAPALDLAVAPLPAIKNGHLTFGCFQNLTKVNEGVLELWGKVLAALPDATLRLQCKQFSEPALVAQLLQRLQRHGIDPARVTTHGSALRETYLAAHAEVDMILDTFPYPGGTTTCEALWMGVPTLTLAGDSLLSRQGASLLSAAGLAEWVANSREEYVARAVAFASDLPRLAALRAGLRSQVLASPLFDAPRFARHFEDALWGMWQRHQEQAGPAA